MSAHTQHEQPDIPREQAAFFGFEPVEKAARQERVNAVFSRVAGRYDLMNDVMSLGLHRLWKRRMVGALRAGALPPDARVLDLAGGTGDITRAIRRVAPQLAVTLCDINPEMLAEGKARLRDANVLHGVDYVTANAERLPFADASFDRVAIAFGIRNVTDIPAALAEIARVLKPGGLFVCLEFSALALPLLRPLYDAYSFHLVPRLGRWIAGDEESYRYLVESIRKFPHQKAFAAMIARAGFACVRVDNLSGGVVALHTGVRP